MHISAIGGSWAGILRISSCFFLWCCTSFWPNASFRLTVVAMLVCLSICLFVCLCLSKLKERGHNLATISSSPYMLFGLVHWYNKQHSLIWMTQLWSSVLKQFCSLQFVLKRRFRRSQGLFRNGKYNFFYTSRSFQSKVLPESASIAPKPNIQQNSWNLYLKVNNALFTSIDALFLLLYHMVSKL